MLLSQSGSLKLPKQESFEESNLVQALAHELTALSPIAALTPRSTIYDANDSKKLTYLLANGYSFRFAEKQARLSQAPSQCSAINSRLLLHSNETSKDSNKGSPYNLGQGDMTGSTTERKDTSIGSQSMARSDAFGERCRIQLNTGILGKEAERRQLGAMKGILRKRDTPQFLRVPGSHSGTGPSSSQSAAVTPKAD